MESITIGQILVVIGLLASAITSISVIGNTLKKSFAKFTAEQTKDIRAEFAEIKQKQDEIETKIDTQEALRWRTQILRANDELIDGKHHTREFFEDLLETIDNYEKFCDKHPGFKNRMATESINHIIETYRKLLTKDTFKRA